MVIDKQFRGLNPTLTAALAITMAVESNYYEQ
jgi:hypothetical protein